ncbi:MAG: cyclase family protein [Pyrinomonadaceae bacterium]|nr:cyclase family protein [Pyrinomonadaceae bacterium]MCX7640677.1 cyclase family protein [Pyrinomonadaceae bacterium]MDW8305361.1 cyclase family protein [Acidobacteriota bacterium]
MRKVVCLSLLLMFCSCAREPNLLKGEWIDLSHDFSEDTIYWNETDSFKKEVIHEGRTQGGYYYSAYRFCTAEHGGTHLDAPIHFAEGRQTVSQLPLNRLIGEGVKIDVSDRARGDYKVSVDDLENWEKANGKIPDGAIVLIQTGYGRYWGDRKSYMGMDEFGERHFPGLSREAAQWLVRERRIGAVGIDTASIDVGSSKNFEAHVALMSENVPAFENVAGLERLPVRGFWVVALPMKIKGGSGAPLRIVAFLPK